MKRMELREVHECESCHKTDTYANACLECGKEFCWDCTKTNGTDYKCGVWSSGSGDGFYCSDCDAALISSGDDKRHNAYRAIQRLKAEAEVWSKDFKKRADAVEAILKEFYENDRRK